MSTAEPIRRELRRFPNLLVAVGIIVIAALAGGSVAIAGLAGPIGVGVLILCAAFSVQRPGLLLGAYILIPFYKATLNPFIPVDLTVALAVLNSAQVLWLLRYGWPRLSSPTVVLWLAMALLVVGGVTYTSDQTVGLATAANWIALVVLPSVAAIRVASDLRHLRDLLWAVLAMGSVVVGLGIVGLGGSERLVVLGANTLQVANAALFVPIIVAYSLPEAPSPLRAVGVLAVPLAIVVAIATGSRGPLLAFGVVVVGTLAARVLITRRIGRAEVVVLLLAGVSMAVVLLIADQLPELSLERLQLFGDFVSRTDFLIVDTSLGGRGDLFATAFSLFAERPLFGHGTGSFAAFAAGTPELAETQYPHNLVLQMGAEFGLIGLVLMVMLVGAGVLRRIPTDPAWSAVRLLFAFEFLTSLTSGDLYGDRMLWILLLLLLAAPSAVGAPGPLPRSAPQLRESS